MSLRTHPSGADDTPTVTSAMSSGQVNRPALSLVEHVVSLTELCEHLGVAPQTIYDLRSQGRGPRGFRVGRELRFRVGEIDRWLRELESEDGAPHELRR